MNILKPTKLYILKSGMGIMSQQNCYSKNTDLSLISPEAGVAVSFIAVPQISKTRVFSSECGFWSQTHPDKYLAPYHGVTLGKLPF